MEFTEHEISLILKGLASLPHRESHALIVRIINEIAKKEAGE